MLQNLIHRLLQRRHFWRYATFSEVAELYASRTMRMFALRIVQTFTSVYLLQEGFSLLFIALFWAAFYLLKVLFSWPAARLIARIGPKHVTLISNLVSALGMVFLPFAPEYGLLALIPWNMLQAFSGCSNDLAYLVDFSKVKNSEHAGKEIGYMNIFEKIATGVSPLIGGGLALLYGPEALMILSAALFLLSAVPLLLTAEPVRIRQKLQVRGFPWRTTWRSMVAESAIGFDVFATGSTWSLFMALVIFSNSHDEIYLQIGAISSVTLVAALASSYAFGRLIDHRRGKELLRLGVILNSTLHFVRPFITTPVSVVLMNSANEAATTAYSMAFMRGLFDTADQSGHRIVYLAFIEMVINFGAALAACTLALIVAITTDSQIGFSVFFMVTGIITLVIMTPRFMLYRR